MICFNRKLVFAIERMISVIVCFLFAKFCTGNVFHNFKYNSGFSENWNRKYPFPNCVSRKYM